MIPKVHRRGVDLDWLVRYLFSPREHGEHDNPRLIAAWQYATTGDLAELQPPTTATGRRSPRRLIDLLEQPVTAGIHPPGKPVWHCSVHNHATDPLLSDQQWAHIAAEIMAGVGLAPHGDSDAVRWIAVRHADNHIHIVATLVRQDGRNAKAWNDYINARAATRELEHHYDLYRATADTRPAAGWPAAIELNKASRQNRAEVPRQQLHRHVHDAAATATNEPHFFDLLSAAGILIRLRTGHPNKITGYAVGLPDHHTATGHAIWYGGGQLAPELSLPKLRRRWTPVLDDHAPTGDPP